MHIYISDQMSRIEYKVMLEVRIVILTRSGQMTYIGLVWPIDGLAISEEAFEHEQRFAFR